MHKSIDRENPAKVYEITDSPLAKSTITFILNV